MNTTTTGNDHKQFVSDANGLDTAKPISYYEWYTPKHIIQATQNVLGQIDLDPCSNSHQYPSVPSRHRYTKEDNGLMHTWKGTVFMNPPYGYAITAWIDKLLLHYHQGDIQKQ